MRETSTLTRRSLFAAVPAAIVAANHDLLASIVENLIGMGGHADA